MRRRHIVTAAAAAAIALSLGTTAAPSAQAAPEDDGGIAVQLVDVVGAPLPLAGAVASVRVWTPESVELRTTETDAEGRAVLPDLPASPWYDVTVEPPDEGAASYAPTEAESVRVVAGATTSVTIPVAIGATVTGRLVGPDGSALAGHEVQIRSDSVHSQNETTTTDPTGRYTFVGLRSDVFEASAAALGGQSRLTWKTRVYAERPGSPPSRVSLSTRLVHTSYTLGVGVGIPSDPQSAVGATVVLTDVATGATAAQRTGGVSGVTQVTHFTVPSGVYTVQIRTVATPRTPAQTWWWTGQRTVMSADPAAAVTTRLDFFRSSGLFAQIP